MKLEKNAKPRENTLLRKKEKKLKWKKTFLTGGMKTKIEIDLGK